MSKNRLEATQNGKLIEIKFTATSEAMADQFFELIELFAITAARIDLENEWNGTQG